MSRVTTWAVLCLLFAVSISSAQQNVELSVQSGHFDQINALAFSPSGQWLASGSDDLTIRIWEVSSGRMLASFLSSAGATVAMAFSPKSDRLAALTSSGFVIVWDISTSSPTRIGTTAGIDRDDSRIFFDNDQSLVIFTSGQLYYADLSNRRIAKEGSPHEFISVVEAAPGSIRYMTAAGQTRLDNHAPVQTAFALNGKDAQLLAEGKSEMQSFQSPKGNILAIIKGWRVEVIQSLVNGKSKAIVGDYIDDSFTQVAISANEDFLVATNTDKQVYFVRLKKKLSIRKLRAHIDDVNTVAISPGGDYFATAGIDRSVILWDAHSLKQVRSFYGKTFQLESVTYLEGNNKVAVGDELGYIKMIDLADRNLPVLSEKVHNYAINQLEFEGDQIVSAGYDNCLKISETLLTTVRKAKIRRSFSPTYSYQNFLGFYRPYPHPLVRMEATASAINGTLKLGPYSDSYKKMAYDRQSLKKESSGNVAGISDSETANIPPYVYSHPRHHTHEITGMATNENGSQLFTTSSDCTLKVWNNVTKELMFTLVPLGIGGSRAIITADTYYMIDRKGFSAINFKVGNKLFSAEQFDLWYNRPDIVLDRLGGHPAGLIEAYHKAYVKRIKRLGFDESKINGIFHAPDLELKYPADLKSEEPTFTFHITSRDSLYALDRLNIWVNGVPESGMAGISFDDKEKHLVSQEHSIQLSRGINKVEVSVMNTQGVESPRKSFEVTYESGPSRKPDLHLVSIGVSQYKNSKFNLQYAASDARDLNKLFADDRRFNKVILHTLTDSEATRENILALKKELEATNVNDHVYVFFSGHGVLNKDLDYFLATHEIDFNDPSSNGLAYEDFERLLDGIPARQKLMMIDACHSGEIDKDEVQQTAKNDPIEKVTTTKSGEYIVESTTIGLQNSFSLMREQFVDLRRSSGATAISAAGGVEFAYEGLGGLKNGVFTHCIIKGLKDKIADANGDGEILLSELQSYVAAEVVRLTQGRQQPTSRVENITNNFKIW